MSIGKKRIDKKKKKKKKRSYKKDKYYNKKKTYGEAHIGKEWESDNEFRL
jgi:hypothetical protein